MPAELLHDERSCAICRRTRRRQRRELLLRCLPVAICGGVLAAALIMERILWG